MPIQIGIRECGNEAAEDSFPLNFLLSGKV